MASGADVLLRNKYKLMRRSRACRIVNPINAFSFPLNVNPLQSVTSVALHSSVFFFDNNLNIFSETKEHLSASPLTLTTFAHGQNYVSFTAVLFLVKAQGPAVDSLARTG